MHSYNNPYFVEFLHPPPTVTFCKNQPAKKAPKTAQILEQKGGGLAQAAKLGTALGPTAGSKHGGLPPNKAE